MYNPTDSSFFAGAGGLLEGFRQAGIKTVRALEYEKNCCDTMRLNFDHEIVCKDARNELVSSGPDTDVISGTYPCQKYSAIGDIHGVRTGDDLFLHFFRNLAIKQPEAYVMENVPGMLKFPVVMEAMTKLPGYYINIFCPLDANNWLPQHRKRLILIGTKRHFTINAPVNNRRLTLKDIMERDVNIAVPEYAINRINGLYRDRPIISDPNKGDIAPTCVAHYHKDVSTRMVVDESYPHKLRPYTVREYARLQGFPDSFKFAGGDREAYKQIGNAVAVDVGRWIGNELMKYFN